MKLRRRPGEQEMEMNSWAGYVLVVMVSEERGEVSRSLNVCPVSWAAVVVPCPGRKCLRMKQGDRSCLHCPSCADSAVADTSQLPGKGRQDWWIPFSP